MIFYILLDFKWLYTVLVYVYATIYLTSPQSMNIFLTLILYTMLLWTFVYRFLCEHTCSILVGIHLGAELPGRVVTLCLAF